MRIKTNDGSIVRLIGWKMNHDNLFLLVELRNRVPHSFICYTVDDDTAVRAIMVDALNVDPEEISRLNGFTLGGTRLKRGTSS